MISSPKSHLGFVLIPLFFLISVRPISSSPSVFDILPEYGLPEGLLPYSVAGYSLSNDGAFTVDLTEPCYVQFEYLVYYEKRITGKLSYGSISDLDGIQVKRAFLWFDVSEIRVDLPPSDSIYFQVGIITKKLDVSQFKTVHSCRDGVSSSCGQSSEGDIAKLEARDEIQMLLTE